MYNDLKTLVDVMYNSKNRVGEKTFLKYRVDEKFTDISYNKFVEMVEGLSGSLYEAGLKKGDRVGIISDNLYKWLVADMAILSLGAADVPRGSDSTPQEVQYILKHSGAVFCFVESPKEADMIISFISEIPELKKIILLTGSTEEVKGKLPSGIGLTTFDELLKDGYKLYEKNRNDIEKIRNSINSDDLVTLIYTSGTTGAPKGVMLTNKNIMHNLHSLPDILPVTHKDRWVSILPVWHVFERTVEYCVMITGGLMAYSKPAAKFLLPDLEEIKPTFMVSVPRVWQSVYNGVLAKVDKGSPVKKGLFYGFLSIGSLFINLKKTILNLHPKYKKEFFLLRLIKLLFSLVGFIALLPLYALGDLLVFRKVRAKTGGKLIGPISGGGALPPYVDLFFAVIGVEIIEGYGLTETSPVVGVRTFSTKVPTTIGRPIPGCQIMIGDENFKPLPCQQDKGIVYIKGDLVMAGYYKAEDKTRAVINDQGWFNSGDLGRLTISGELHLCGRAKDTIVLIGGENIEPEPIEAKILEDQMIHQVIIAGQDQKVLSALICPNDERLLDFAKSHGIQGNTRAELIKNPKIIEEYERIAKTQSSPKNGFKSYERVQFITLLNENFELGKEMTNSLKLKRNVIFDKYSKEISEMYK